VDLSAKEISFSWTRGKIIPHQRDPVTMAAGFIEPPITTLAAIETAPQRQILRPQPGLELLFYTGLPSAETALLRQDFVFRVGARLGKIKRKELDNASTAVCGNVLRFIRTFEQYIEAIRPDPTKEEMVELLRDFFSDTLNFVHRQVLQTSALHILLWEVLFADGTVQKLVGGSCIPSRLIKVL
jgi:hypothetical protein